MKRVNDDTSGLSTVSFTPGSFPSPYGVRSEPTVRSGDRTGPVRYGGPEGTELVKDLRLSDDHSLLSVVPSPSPYDRSCHSATLRSFTLLR